MAKTLNVEWSPAAVDALQAIYIYYAEFSEDTAQRIINELIDLAENITFPEQYQQDELSANYRRAIVRHYKLLYRTDNDVIYIVLILDTRQKPLAIE